MAADLISNLPEESDANYPTMEAVARNVCGIAFAGG